MEKIFEAISEGMKDFNFNPVIDVEGGPLPNLSRGEWYLEFMEEMQQVLVLSIHDDEHLKKVLWKTSFHRLPENGVVEVIEEFDVNKMFIERLKRLATMVLCCIEASSRVDGF